jgi:lycopene cyclase domain-containing protein
MSYFTFLAIFIGLPLSGLFYLLRRDKARGRLLPSSLQGAQPGITLLALVLVAVIYTTPWDNYLVATEVWWYDPNLVNGLTLGWVPIEEYLFFILQTLMVGFWLIWLAQRIQLNPKRGSNARLRWHSSLILVLIWLLSAAILASDWTSGTYLALILVWAIPPILVQIAFGADILWQFRRLVILGILIPTLYLGFADTIAIQAGTWTISPQQSLEIFLPGGLPIEEFTFFLVTNVLVVFGLTLVLANESWLRLSESLNRIGVRQDYKMNKFVPKPVPVRRKNK